MRFRSASSVPLHFDIDGHVYDVAVGAECEIPDRIAYCVESRGLPLVPAVATWEPELESEVLVVNVEPEPDAMPGIVKARARDDESEPTTDSEPPPPSQKRRGRPPKMR